MSSNKQFSFAGGELAPALYGRGDQPKYQAGMSTILNWIVQRFGSATTRAGTVYAGDSAQPIAAGRFIPFVASASQGIVLEIINQAIRFWKNGMPLGPAVGSVAAYAVGTTYANGDIISSSGIYYQSIQNSNVGHTPASSPTYWYSLGAAVNGVAQISITSPWLTADLPLVKFAQSVDVMTLVHPGYKPQELKHLSDTSWTLTPTTVNPSQAAPSAVNATGTGGAVVQRYKVTAVNSTNAEESMPGVIAATVAVSQFSSGNPWAVQANAHGLTTGECVSFGSNNPAPFDDLNGAVYQVTVIDANNFTLDGTVLPPGWGGGFLYGGTLYKNQIKVTLTAASAGAPITVSWAAAAGASDYVIYKELNGVYGFIGTARGLSFVDTGYTPNVSYNTPDYKNPFAANNYPACVTYYQQRRVFGNFIKNTEQAQASKIGQYYNFTKSDPIQSDDAITWNMNGRTINPVRHMVEVQQLIVLTATGEWTVTGDSTGTLTPTAVNPRQQGYSGCTDLVPIIIQNTLLFVQARGNIIRDLAYDWSSGGYVGRELSIFSNHLFDGYTVVAWGFQQVPNSVVWAVRSDGMLLGLTYVREHDIWSWHRHQTDGLIEDVCVVPEGNEDAVYLKVVRTTGRGSLRYVERMKKPALGIDAHQVDSGIIWDGRAGAGTASTITLADPSGLWNQTSPYIQATISAGYPTMSAGDVLIARDASSNAVRLTLLSTGPAGAGGVWNTTANKAVPAGLQSGAIAAAQWDWAPLSFTAAHLPNKTLSILGDGSVQAQRLTDGSGVFTMPYPSAVVHAGLPYNCDLVTLDLEQPPSSGETLLNKSKIVTQVDLALQDSLGVWAGPDLTALRELKNPNQPAAAPGVAPTRMTGTFPLNIPSRSGRPGRCAIRVSDPVPATVLAIIPTVTVGGV